MDSTFPIKKIGIELESHDRVELTLGKDLSLNYLRGDGIPALRDWVREHVNRLHQPQDFSTCITVGSTDALAKSFTLLSGNAVLFDEFAYGTAVSACRSLGRTCVGVKMDSHGMVPEDLKTQTLRARERGLDPDTVYLVPTAQNPTGVSMPLARKEAIYRVCQELDLIILEDDAYYYLYHTDSHPVEMSGANIPVDQLPGTRSLPK